jgi:PAS domain S-box-containing protein
MAKLLIVDDNEQDLYMLRALLEGHGHEVAVAANGDEALKAAREMPPCVIITDILMPGMDGYSLCRNCKRDDMLSGIPLVFYTATYTDAKDQQFAMSLGAARFIVKPEEPDVLVSILEDVMKESRDGGQQISSIEPAIEEEVCWKSYNCALIRKLEDKLLQLESARSSLESEIKEHEQADNALRESEERFFALFDQAPLGYQSLDEDGRFLEVNQAWLKTLGYGREEVIGRWFGDFLDQQFVNSFRQCFAMFKAAGKIHSEFRMLHKDGKKRFISFEGRIGRNSDGSFKRTHCILEDITERKRAEEELQFKNLILSTQQETSIDGILVVDENARIISFNRRFKEILGIPGQLLESKEDEPVLQFVTDKMADPEQFLNKVRQLYAMPNETSRDEITLKDGTTIDRYSAPMLDSSGKYFGRVWYFRDITERKRVEEALRENQENYKGLVENISGVVYSLDNEGTLVYVSPKAKTIFGFEPSEVLGRKFNEFIYEEDLPFLMAEFKKLTEGTVDPAEYRIRKKSGEPVWVRSITNKFFDKSGNMRFQGVLEDISKQKEQEEENRRIQEQLQQSQKLEAVGQLAGGVAHDFNNMLCVILGEGEILLDQLGQADPLRESAEEIVAAAERSAELTGQLLAFSRKQTFQLEVLDLNDIVKNLKKMLRRLIVENIEFRTSLAKDLCLVNVDQGQVEQVIINMAINAQDAMPQGGKLTIETANVEIDEPGARRHIDMFPGKFVMLAITDTGKGMDKDTLCRIFEPFFTTKEKGKGTGLGLSTVYGIVKQLKGYIRVYSEPRIGTTFKVFFPVVEAESASADIQASVDRRDLSGNGEKILLVEDEPALQKICSRILRGLNYEVTIAANGIEALLLVEEEGLRPDLVITDVVMPGMGGNVLVERLLRIQPGLKILYMSGYTDEAIVNHDMLKQGMPFIQKPFSVNDFSAKIKSLLQDESP